MQEKKNEKKTEWTNYQLNWIFFYQFLSDFWGTNFG